TLEAVHLLVGIDIAQFRDPRQTLLEDGGPMIEIIEIVRLQGVLVLRTAEATADRKILGDLEIKRSSRNLCGGLSYPGDHLVDADFPFAERLELAEHARGAAAATSSSSEGRQSINRRILQHDLRENAHFLRHRGEG